MGEAYSRKTKMLQGSTQGAKLTAWAMMHNPGQCAWMVLEVQRRKNGVKN